MRFEYTPLAAVLLMGAPFTGSLPAPAEIPWMSEEAMRADLTGRTLEGYYHFPVSWTASFEEGGRYHVRERDLEAKELQAEGRWYFRGRAFCLFYGPPSWPLLERCAAVTKISANCYEFHLVWPGVRPRLDDGGFRPQPLWHSRGWRRGEPPTCEEKPTV